MGHEPKAYVDKHEFYLIHSLIQIVGNVGGQNSQEINIARSLNATFARNISPEHQNSTKTHKLTISNLRLILSKLIVHFSGETRTNADGSFELEAVGDEMSNVDARLNVIHVLRLFQKL